MGLGKTVQMISLILAHRPEKKPRSTLIVVPLALVEQWRLEIEEKTRDDTLAVIVHHGPKRTKGPSWYAMSPLTIADPKVLRRADVVITTYEVVASEWLDESKASSVDFDGDDVKAESESGTPTASTSSAAKGKAKAAPKAKPRAKPKVAGALFQTAFHRVILDEACVAEADLAHVAGIGSRTATRSNPRPAAPSTPSSAGR